MLLSSESKSSSAAAQAGIMRAADSLVGGSPVTARTPAGPRRAVPGPLYMPRYVVTSCHQPINTIRFLRLEKKYDISDETRTKLQSRGALAGPDPGQDFGSLVGVRGGKLLG